MLYRGYNVTYLSYKKIVFHLTRKDTAIQIHAHYLEEGLEAARLFDKLDYEELNALEGEIAWLPGAMTISYEARHIIGATNDT